MFHTVLDVLEYKTVMNIYHQVFPAKLRIPSKEVEFRWRKNYYKIITNENVTVFAIIIPHNGMIHIDYLGVASDHQGKGLAKKMMMFLQEIGKPLSLECERNLISFYAKFGFEETDHLNVNLPFLCNKMDKIQCRKILYYLQNAFSLEPYHQMYIQVIATYCIENILVQLYQLYKFHHVDGFIA